MIKLISFFILFNICIASEFNKDPSYEIELPNEEKDQNLVKVLQIFTKENVTDKFKLNIFYKFENDWSNNFILDSTEMLDVLTCIISEKCANAHKAVLFSEDLYVKSSNTGIFPLCIYKQMVTQDKKDRYFKTMCLDKNEYKRFINIIAYLLNLVHL